MWTPVKLRPKMLLGYTVPIAAYLIVAGIPIASTVRQALDTFQEVERVQNVILNINQMSRGAQGMETSSRGYLADADPAFIEEYHRALELFHEASESIEPLIIVSEQQERLENLREIKVSTDAFITKIIRLVNEGKQAEAVELFETGIGIELGNEFEKIYQEFSRTEKQLLAARTSQARAALRSLIGVLLLASLLLVSLAIGAALWISSGVARTITLEAEAIAHSATEIAVTMEQQERVVTQQASAVNQTTATIDGLNAAAHQAADRADSAAKNAREALNLTESGTAAVGETLQGMATLHEKVAAIAEQTQHLSQHTGQISSIARLVTDLATQTNMLALNAAVEAVRAGEHGKGFGVVATEIRKLADQSKRSAERIDILVADIQRAIHTTVKATREGSQTVERGVQIAQQTADALSGVENAIDEVSLNTEQISLGAQEQANDLQQILAAMNALNQVSQDSAGGIAQVRIGTQNLNEAAKHIRQIV